MSRHVAAVIVLIMVVATSHGHAQDATAVPPASPLSLEQVSEGLKRPGLEIPPLPPPPAGAVPTFHVSVEGNWPLETPLQAIRRELAEEQTLRAAHGTPAGMTPTLASVDVLPAIVGAITKVKAAYHEHLEADAAKRVAEDLAAFCAINDCSQVSPVEGVVITPPPPR